MFRTLKAFFSPYIASEDQLVDLQNRYRAAAATNNEYANALTEIQSIESKSGTLLTHISLMIGVTGIFWATKQDSAAYQLVLGIELIAYLLLAVVCIRCQFQLTSGHFSKLVKGKFSDNMGQWTNEQSKIVMGEAYFRETLFRFSFFSVYLLTIALVVTIAVLLVYPLPRNLDGQSAVVGIESGSNLPELKGGVKPHPTDGGE